MAILSNINGKFAVDSTGAIQFSGSAGTSGYILRSNGNAAPTWVDSSTVIGGPYLPLTGGTLSGALAGTSATFSGTITTPQINLNSAGGGIIDNQTGNIFIQTPSGTGWIFRNGPSGYDEKMRIAPNGNVGIGVTVPGARLELDNPSAFTNMIEYGNVAWNQSTGHGLVAVNRGSDGYVQLQITSGVDNADVFTIRNSGTGANIQHNFLSNGNAYHAGNVGIGTSSPGAKLDVVSPVPTCAIFDTTSSSYGAMNVYKAQGVVKGNAGYNSGSMYFGGEAGTNTIIQSGGQTGIFINNSTKNVGIGTTSPSQKLHVVGKSLFTDDIQLTQTSPRIDYGNTTVGTLRFFSVYENSVKMELYDGGRLYPTGGVFLGSSNNSNLLDDYEEGTWTPAIAGVTTLSSGRYVKIGNMVKVYGVIRQTSGTSTTHTVTGLPFTTSGSSRSPMNFSQINSCSWGSGATMLVSFIYSAQFSLYGNSNGNALVQTPNNFFSTNSFMEFGGTYIIF